MAQLEVINVGSTANDGQGDPLRVAFEKVNNNFANLWATGYNTLEAITIGDTAGQLIFSIPTSFFTQAQIQINSSNQNTNDSQNITITAGITNDQTDVRWSGHSTLFNGDPVTGYSMDVAGGNVNLYADPLVDDQLTHWIAYQVTFDPMTVGAYLILNQNDSNAISTENLQVITTEQ